MRYHRLINLLLLYIVVVTALCPRRTCAQDLEQGIKDIAQQLSAEMGGQVRKLAIVEFPDLNGYQSALGQFVAEELITQLSVGGKSGKFDVVERRQLARVLKEQELSDSSLFDADSIARIGKILGIEAIVTGSIADLGTDIKINARAISIETAKIFAAASAKIPKNETVQQLMHQTAGPAQSSQIAGGASGSSRIPGRQVQRGDVFFQNEFLRVEVSSVAVAKSKNRVSFALIFQNLSAQDLFLALDRGYSYCRARVTDNLGAVVPTKGYGEGVFVTGLPCLYGDGERKNQQEYAKLSPNSRTSVVMAFETEHEQFEGNIYSISAELLKFNGGDWSKFAMGVSDIEVNN